MIEHAGGAGRAACDRVNQSQVSWSDERAVRELEEVVVREALLAPSMRGCAVTAGLVLLGAEVDDVWRLGSERIGGVGWMADDQGESGDSKGGARAAE